jgi:hypothetical protein
LGWAFTFWLPFSQISIAGSWVTATSRSLNDPNAWPRKRSFCFSISCWDATPWFEVANHECQISVIRSISGAFVRTILSSQKRWSSPTTAEGERGRPLSAVGAGPVSA